MQLAQLGEQRFEVDAAVRRRVRREPAHRFRKLAFGRNRPASARLVPRNRDVDEPLQEVALLRRSRAPRVLELLVCGEVLAGADQREPAFELRF
jgi:hypothetical protein